MLRRRGHSSDQPSTRATGLDLLEAPGAHARRQDDDAVETQAAADLPAADAVIAGARLPRRTDVRMTTSFSPPPVEKSEYGYNAVRSL